MDALSPEISAKVNVWLEGNYDEQTKAAIREQLDAKEYEAITDAFYKDLEFGTGGLRGIMGPGSNRVNIYTIGMATQGLANFLKKTFAGEALKVAVAHDSRNRSDLFARTTASVFSANGIKVYFFESLRPTPELSFAIRQLGCQGGVMVTASHNPKEYNGYKVYGANGGQIVSPHDTMIINEVRDISSVDDVSFTPNEDLISTIGADMDEQYMSALEKLSISKMAIQRQHDLKIVFSPIHGTGAPSVPNVLKRFGFTNVMLVEEQLAPDGNFPTVVYPNPEEHEALSMALAKGQAENADLVMATDPDADRVGIAVRNTKGEFVLLNGNQTGALLIRYLLDAWKDHRKLTEDCYVVKTIVTTYLIDKMAKDYGVKCYNTLTGFKHIAALMTKLEGKETFIGGGEESYGYLIGDLVRDKDAVVSAAFIAEMTAYYKDKGMGLYEAMVSMYCEYDCYQEELLSFTKKGKKGAEEIQAMMERFRKDPPKSLAGETVETIKDYSTLKSHQVATGKVTDIHLPSSNVLQFITSEGSIISARPSGTEPKIKFYVSVNTPLENAEDYEKTTLELKTKIKNIISDLNI